MTNGRQTELSQIRKLVRGVGVVKGVWRLSVAELRREADRILVGRKDWLTPREQQALASFVWGKEVRA